MKVRVSNIDKRWVIIFLAASSGVLHKISFVVYLTLAVVWLRLRTWRGSSLGQPVSRSSTTTDSFMADDEGVKTTYEAAKNELIAAINKKRQVDKSLVRTT